MGENEEKGSGEISVCINCYNTDLSPFSAVCNRCGSQVESIKPGTLVAVLKRELAMTKSEVLMLSSQIQYLIRHCNEQRELVNQVVTFITSGGDAGPDELSVAEDLKQISEMLRSIPENKDGSEDSRKKKRTVTEISFSDDSKARELNIGPDVLKFARAMEERLVKENIWKGFPEGHPDSPPIDFFLDKLGKEVNELVEAVEKNRENQTHDGILSKAANVANAAMFITKVTRAL